MEALEPEGKRLPPTGPLQQVTVRGNDWAYAHVEMIFDPPYTKEEAVGPGWPPDILTWRTMLTSALTQYLGVFGSAIHIDILHLDEDEAWLRVPAKGMKKFSAAVGGYVGSSDGRTAGFRIINIGEYMMGIVGRKAESDIWTD